MTPVRLEPVALRSRVKHSTTEIIIIMIIIIIIIVILKIKNKNKMKQLVFRRFVKANGILLLTCYKNYNIFFS